mmetsp:Transcript_16662/g.23590  ORF Transcript_16662/g.23590 Transcript_16662/m.23590 type:complete len:230 (-) Transcript_16662:3550-4239(-)
MSKLVQPDHHAKGHEPHLQRSLAISLKIQASFFVPFVQQVRGVDLECEVYVLRLLQHRAVEPNRLAGLIVRFLVEVHEVRFRQNAPPPDPTVGLPPLFQVPGHHERGVVVPRLFLDHAFVFVQLFELDRHFDALALEHVHVRAHPLIAQIIRLSLSRVFFHDDGIDVQIRPLADVLAEIIMAGFRGVMHGGISQAIGEENIVREGLQQSQYIQLASDATRVNQSRKNSI